MENKVVLITGAARRIGAAIARDLHGRGARLMLHYRGSAGAALSLAAELNGLRPGSVATWQADLLDLEQLPLLVAACIERFGTLDGLVNNASSFFATPLGAVDAAVWDDLMGSNLRAPLFLSQAAAPYLAASGGAIVGIVDIHAERPLKDFVVYSLAKAGHAQLIRSLALELAPSVRVNGVAPGANLWPESAEHFSDAERARIETSIPLGRTGMPQDLARAVAFLLSDEAAYITGQVLAVDGGRSVVL
jgi:pteridine reductase